MVGAGACALSASGVRSAAAASLMTPATATVHFENEADDTVLRFSFVEFLWRNNGGEVDCHLEIDTEQFRGLGRPGVFRKGGATGTFYVYFGQDLLPTGPKFWWPPGAVSQQPPLKGGQNRGGRIERIQGLARNSFTTGYELPVPKVGDQRVTFEMSGFGKSIVEVGAEHFIDRGAVKIYCDFSYMTGQ